MAHNRGSVVIIVSYVVYWSMLSGFTENKTGNLRTCRARWIFWTICKWAVQVRKIHCTVIAQNCSSPPWLNANNTIETLLVQYWSYGLLLFAEVKVGRLRTFRERKMHILTWVYICRIVHIIVPYVGGQFAKIGVLVSKQDQTRHTHVCRHMVCDTK